MNGIDFLADTNFLIFTSQGNPIVETFLDYNIGISFISEMELLGVFSISKIQKSNMQKIIDQCFVIDFNLEIKKSAIQLKQKYKVKLPDAIIAATAIHYNIPFITADADFKIIKELDLIFIENS
ncbi:type II toxin-antitoxin system VapC family toxin [Flavobacterium macrobrachii]|jgi:predicted nucleic acid-binding protein|uniref:Type II toxin-antitoxin system VapC family toxin n=1 Tax=Flavobacterium macrobrachii TaxID=591204 RepID=A0ABS2CVZ6_9FLAO|nr:type II toxin-antitoxin system VapC family toxin [Flavobacterium macrobrachii]MBM6499123.1 type II toxin-antitoxin system VapC family toxin [Flavobacterium macrobrachii]